MKKYILSIVLVFVTSISTAAAATQSVPVNLKDGDVTYKGELFLPKKAKGEVPLVLVVHEWWGKTEYPAMRAKKIANELGFAALAVDLYGEGKTVNTPKEAQALAGPFYKDPDEAVDRLQEFVEAAPAAAKTADVALNMNKVAAVGYCFGGTQALNLAREGELPGDAKLAAVVATHAGLASSLKADEKIEAKVLVLHGEADPMVKQEEVAAFKEEMKKAKADLTFIGYPGATHAFTNPNATKIGKKHGIPIAYNKSADAKSWKATTKFLKETLGK